jgi:hypothetical protein
MTAACYQIETSRAAAHPHHEGLVVTGEAFGRSSQVRCQIVAEPMPTLAAGRERLEP